MIELTDERVIPELMKPNNGMLLEHHARYYFAASYANGRVLDIACGCGYGSQMIAKLKKKVVSEVVAVDNDSEIIEYAEKTYNHPRVTYRIADAVDSALPERLGLFDTVVSLETVEHLKKDLQFIDNLYNMLKAGGTLVLSTPFGCGRGEDCGESFHIRQYTVEEFKELFASFGKAEFYYQWGVLIEPPRKNVRYPLGIAVCTK